MRNGEGNLPTTRINFRGGIVKIKTWKGKRRMEALEIIRIVLDAAIAVCCMALVALAARRLK